LRGFPARELLVVQGLICGVSAQGKGDAKLDIQAKLVVGRTGGTPRLRSLLFRPPKKLQTSVQIKMLAKRYTITSHRFEAAPMDQCHLGTTRQIRSLVVDAAGLYSF